MKALSVWAPKAKSVALCIQGETFPMTPREYGHFVATLEFSDTQVDYGFSIDGGPCLPDPRSPFQPQGVHGPSRWTPTQFDWTDDDFHPTPLDSAIIYELHVGTFARDGTFDGVIERLEYLETLGITHVELMPIAQFPGVQGWGYDGVHLYAPHAAYGGPVAFKRLVNACHAHGLSVLLDVVYNHFGPDGNYLPQYGPYLVENADTPWGSAVNFDGEHSEGVRQFLIKNALYWFEEFHCDGLRLDAVHAIRDNSARHFLEELSDETAKLSKRLAKTLVLIAESDLNEPRLLRSREEGGCALDAMWSDDFHHALHVVLTGERSGVYSDFSGLPDLAQAIQHGLVYDGKFSRFRNHHHGQPMGNVSLRRLVGYCQNHDQVGNRALGERLPMLISARRARLGAFLVLFGPYIPLLFQGEEWASKRPFLYFVNHENLELAQAVSKGRRGEFLVHGYSPDTVPDPSAYETFDKSRIDFGEATSGEHAATLEFYRQLIRLRREQPEWFSPAVVTHYDETTGTLVLERECSEVVVHFGDQGVTMPIREGWPRPFLAFGTEGATLDERRLKLDPESAALYVKADK